jgi:hypothetical protein
MHGLAAICHEVPKGGHNGSRWPTHWRAFSLLDIYAPQIRAVPFRIIKPWIVEVDNRGI